MTGATRQCTGVAGEQRLGLLQAGTAPLEVEVDERVEAEVVQRMALGSQIRIFAAHPERLVIDLLRRVLRFPFGERLRGLRLQCEPGIALDVLDRTGVNSVDAVSADP